MKSVDELATFYAREMKDRYEHLSCITMEEAFKAGHASRDSEVAELKDALDKLDQNIGSCGVHRRSLQAQVALLEEAVKFYSDVENFNFLQTDKDNLYFVEGMDENAPLKDSPADYDQVGKRALAALEKLAEMRK